PVAPHLRQQVVRHVLLVIDPLSSRRGADILVCQTIAGPSVAIGVRARESLDDLAPIRLTRRYYLVDSGMRLPRQLKVVRINLLIDHDTIVAVSPRSHHGRRNVPRPGPHGESKWSWR